MLQILKVCTLYSLPLPQLAISANFLCTYVWILHIAYNIIFQEMYFWFIKGTNKKIHTYKISFASIKNRILQKQNVLLGSLSLALLGKCKEKDSEHFWCKSLASRIYVPCMARLQNRNLSPLHTTTIFFYFPMHYPKHILYFRVYSKLSYRCVSLERVDKKCIATYYNLITILNPFPNDAWECAATF